MAHQKAWLQQRCLHLLVVFRTSIAFFTRPCRSRSSARRSNRPDFVSSDSASSGHPAPMAIAAPTAAGSGALRSLKNEPYALLWCSPFSRAAIWELPAFFTAGFVSPKRPYSSDHLFSSTSATKEQGRGEFPVRMKCRVVVSSEGFLARPRQGQGQPFLM